jgi:ferredoxin
MGMLRNLAGSDRLGPGRPYDVAVVHINVAEDTSIFRSELLAGHAQGRFTLVEHFDDRSGLFDVDTLGDLVPDLAERTTFACGPAALLDALQEHHDRLGLELQTEKFRVARVEPGEGGSVAFDRQGTAIELDGATPILEAAEEAGVLMPSGCRMGICMSCVLPLKEGAVRDLRNGAVTTVDPGAAPHEWTKVQTCINAAAGACHLDH